MTITNLLLALIVLILSHRWIYPTWKARQAKKAGEKQARLRAEVEPYYQEFLAKMQMLRTQYDPEFKYPRFAWTDPNVPADYRAAMDTVIENYKGILAVKFGESFFFENK